MRWMWIDRIVELERGRRLVAIKNVSLAEDHLHDHFEADPERGLPALPVMPASLIIEGMAQTAGVLVGHAEDFKQKVVLAKVSRAEITEDAAPGSTLRYTATILQMTPLGASTEGTIDLIDHATPDAPPRTIGRIDLMFSHLDQNMGGMEFPKENFIFGDGFRMLLKMSGFGD